MGSPDRNLLQALKAISAERTLEGFGRTVARELYALIRGVSTSYNEVNPQAPKAMAFIHPEPDDHWWTIYTPPFEAHMYQHPVLRHFAVTGSFGPTTWAEVDPTGAFFGTELYQQFYRPIGIHSQVVVQVPAAHGVVIGVAVNRDGTGFAGAAGRAGGWLHQRAAGARRPDRWPRTDHCGACPEPGRHGVAHRGGGRRLPSHRQVAGRAGRCGVPDCGRADRRQLLGVVRCGHRGGPRRWRSGS